MPLAVRRLVYSLLALLGFAMMMPLMVSMRRLQAELWVDPGAVESALDPSAAWAQGPLLMFLIGLALAGGFLYAALSAGYARAWRPKENGEPRCSRCGREVRFGLGRCPTCDQQLAW